MMVSPISAPSLVIRSASHFGTRPPCSGRSAVPALLAISRTAPMVVRGHRGQHLSSHVVRSEHGTGSVPCRAPAKAHPWQTAFRARAFQARILRSDMAVGSRRLRSRARDDSAAETAHALAASTVSRMSLRPHKVSGLEKPQTGRFGALLTLGYVDGDALPFRQTHD